jgi:hypothetical protein
MDIGKKHRKASDCDKADRREKNVFKRSIWI